MTAHQAVHRVATMCRVLGVSPSGHYAWRKRPLSARARADVELSAEIHAIHRESHGTYGAPRIHADLAARGIGNHTLRRGRRRQHQRRQSQGRQAHPALAREAASGQL